MKFYYSPGACSLAAHIVAREAGIGIQPVRVDLASKRTEHDDDFLRINPKGYVPALELDDGQVLTEGLAILLYLADSRPDAGLAASGGGMARARLHEALGHVATELHKSYSPLFNPATPEPVREERRAYLRKRYAGIEATLAAQPWLSGAEFGIADAYLYAVTNWADHVGVDLSGFDALSRYMGRIAARPAVRAARMAEGLVVDSAA